MATITNINNGESGLVARTKINNNDNNLNNDKMEKSANLSDVSSRQTSLNNLTDVASATNEHILTKDTATGDVIFKAATGGGATNLAFDNQTTTQFDITSSSGTDATVTGATGSLAGAMVAADKTKLDGIAASATANDTDANLRDRTTHTGHDVFPEAVVPSPPAAGNLIFAVKNESGQPRGYFLKNGGSFSIIPESMQTTTFSMPQRLTPHTTTATGATFTWNMGLYQILHLTLGANTEINASNFTSGVAYQLVVTQDATTQYTLGFDTEFVFPDGTPAFVMPSDPSKAVFSVYSEDATNLMITPGQTFAISSGY